MNPNLKFDFTVDKEKNRISVKREFSANVELVWRAWTDPEVLEQWWAPKPYKAITKSMNFREGGTWLYYMLSPENEKHWCKADYKKINPLKSFSGMDAFCDENGIVNPDFPRSLWQNVFSELNEKTTVDITIQYDSLAELEKIVELGFKEGFTMALGNLDQYLEAQEK